MFRCTGDSVSKDHGKIRIFSAVYIFSDKLVIAGCYRLSKHFSMKSPEGERLAVRVFMDLDHVSPVVPDSKGPRHTVYT